MREKKFRQFGISIIYLSINVHLTWEIVKSKNRALVKLSSIAKSVEWVDIVPLWIIGFRFLNYRWILGCGWMDAQIRYNPLAESIKIDNLRHRFMS